MGDSNPSRALCPLCRTRLDCFGLSYRHLIEPRVKGGRLPSARARSRLQEFTDFSGTQFIAAGASTDTPKQAAEMAIASLIAFVRHFIANPDRAQASELGCR